VVPPPIIRSPKIVSTDAVDPDVCVSGDEWRYLPKYVEQFSDKINCVTLHLVGYIFEY
jgi:hypothetical protein